MVVLSAGLLVWKRARAGAACPARAPGRAVVDAQGRGRLVHPKGEVEPGEDPYAAAVREFNEETGAAPPDGPSIALGRSGSGRQARGGLGHRGHVQPGHARARALRARMAAEERAAGVVPRDRPVEWFDLDTARRKLLGAQWPLVEALVALVG